MLIESLVYHILSEGVDNSMFILYHIDVIDTEYDPLAFKTTFHVQLNVFIDRRILSFKTMWHVQLNVFIEEDFES